MQPSSLLNGVQWAGSIVGLLGAFLLATHSRLSRWGWIAFFGSNVLLIVFTAGLELWGLLIMQVGFLATSVLGIYRSFRSPLLAAAGRTEVAPVYLSTPSIGIEVQVDRDGSVKRTSLSYRASEVAPHMVERWLSERNLVAMPAGIDFSKPVKPHPAPSGT